MTTIPVLQSDGSRTRRKRAWCQRHITAGTAALIGGVCTFPQHPQRAGHAARVRVTDRHVFAPQHEQTSDSGMAVVPVPPTWLARMGYRIFRTAVLGIIAAVTQP